jgi:predicted nucleic acid-binding protein
VPVVVSDTSPIRCLAHIGRLDLLPALFGDVIIPPAVVRELARPKTAFTPVDVGAIPGLRIQSPSNRRRVDEFLKELEEGESEALALALEVNAIIVLMDESAGRAIAVREGLVPIGVIGVLSRAKQRNLLPAIKPLLDQLISELKFFVSDQLRDRALRDAGENP